MNESVLIVMTSGPDTPRRCASPFHFASLAAAMDYDTYMFFTIDGILLLKRGVAETLYAKAGGEPVSRFMQQAQEAGVRFIACTSSLELHDLRPEDLMDGVEMAGGATMLELAENARTVLTF